MIPAGEKFEPAHVGGYTFRMTEIKLGRTPHFALSIPHLNGSFPVFI
jgi:hypothetical protein